MSYTPFNFAQINSIEGTFVPSTNKNFNNKAFDFWVRALFQRACSTLEITLPTEWTVDGRKDFFYYVLFRNGFLAVTEVAKYGTIFQPCTISGYNLYYQPNKVLIANPVLDSSLEREIGVDCALIKLCPDYLGIWDIITYYAEKLALLDSAVNMSLINSKLAYILGAKDKVSGEALKKIQDKIASGEPTVVFDMKLLNNSAYENESPWQEFTRDVKNSYITTDLLQDWQTILNAFDCEIGIPTVPYQKKERMVTSEAESKQLDATSRATVWKDTLERSFERVNELYNLGLSVKLRYDIVESEGVQNGKNDNDRLD